MNCLQNLKAPELESLFAPGALDLKEAAVLSKYVARAFRMLGVKDSQTGTMVSHPALMKI